MSPMWRMTRMGWLCHYIKRFNWCANNWAALRRRQWASSWGNSSVWRTQRCPWNPWRVQVIRSSNRVCHPAWPTRKIESPTMQSLSLRKMWTFDGTFWSLFPHFCFLPFHFSFFATQTSKVWVFLVVIFSPCLGGCFLKWWYPQNTPKWSFLVGKPMVVGYHHCRKPPGEHV